LFTGFMPKHLRWSRAGLWWMGNQAGTVSNSAGSLLAWALRWWKERP